MPAIHSHSTEYQASEDEGGPQVWQGQAARATLGAFPVSAHLILRYFHHCCLQTRKRSTRAQSTSDLETDHSQEREGQEVHSELHLP